jgi:DNA-binding transcriptional ArsR family regulator
MRLKKHNNIRESEVEDALVSNLFYLKKTLNLTYDIKIIARQLELKSREQRLDLLIAHGKELCLIELKVTRFDEKYINQLNDYREELLKLQKQGELVSGRLRAFLLVTGFLQKEKELCESHKIEIVEYKPIDVLRNYYENLAALAPFLKIKPHDYGVFNIGLINRVLNELNKGIVKQEELTKVTKLSKGSVHNHLTVAKELGLVRERNKQFSLTDLGDQYLASGSEGAFISILSEEQSEKLKRFIAQDPFYSSTVFGIYSIVESAFILSRNSYPINFEDLVKMFKTTSGKISEWRAVRSQNTATYTFLNFAIDLGLLGKIGRQIVITPAGFRFILMLQLHKSIEMVESLSIETKPIEK